MKCSRKRTLVIKLWKAYWAALLLISGVLQFVGCAVGPKYKTPPVPSPPAYKEIGNWKTAQPDDQHVGGNWWEIFQDPQLNALEQQINVSNQNLKAAAAQYQQARAVLRYYRADYYPTISAAPSATRNRYSKNRPPQSSTFSGITFSDFAVPLDFSYQVNAWGRVSRNVESYREQAQASAADLAVVNLSMHSDLAVDYFAARSLDAEEKLLRDTVAQYEQALNLNEDRYQGGLASEVDVQQARTILETTRAQMVDVGVARAQYEHAVAVLIGKPPAGVSLHRVAVDEHPDLYVYYHMVTQEVMDSTTTDDGFGWGGGRWGRWGGWGGWGGPDIAQTEARPRMMGILVIDLVDGKRKQMVWRGQAMEDSISN